MPSSNGKGAADWSAANRGAAGKAAADASLAGRGTVGKGTAGFAAVAETLGYIALAWALRQAIGLVWDSPDGAAFASLLVMALLCWALYRWVKRRDGRQAVTANVNASRAVNWLAGAAVLGIAAGFLPMGGGAAPIASALGVLASCVAGPIAEELLFRGVILRQLEAPFGRHAALVLSSLLFAAAHGSLPQAIVALAGGLLFGAAYQRSRSIGLAIAAHALANGSSLAVQAVLAAF